MNQKALTILTLIIGSMLTEGGDSDGQLPPPPSPTGQHTTPPNFVPPNLHTVKSKLEKFVDEELDRNKDSYITVDELRDWLKSEHLESMKTNVEAQWKHYQPEELQNVENSLITWEQYRKLTYPDSLFQTHPAEEVAAMKDMLRRLERRWNKADSNGDKALTKEEFKTFLHPEESEKTSEVVVDEAMEDVDKDKNGEVSLEEYMQHSMHIAGEEKNDPSWAQAQQGYFVNYLDKNKDSCLNKEELKDWILPPYDRHEAEAWRLISLVDQDRDTKITKQDVLNHHQFFVPLKPHDYWTDGQSQHDEF